jgi:hypothetical protein
VVRPRVQTTSPHVLVTRVVVQIGIGPDVGELVKHHELEVTAHADEPRVVAIAKSAKVTGAHRLVIAESDLEVRQAQPGGLETGQRIVEQRPLPGASAMNDDHRLASAGRSWFLSDHAQHDGDRDEMTEGH